MPGRRFDSFTSDERPERPSDPAVRKANLRRIIRLFRPYRARLAAVCALIVFSAAIGVVSPFLLREVLDVAIPDENVRLLTALVAGMVGISIATGVIGVYQTLLSNQVGQSVMHDLRTKVYRHLQRLSLAFFTRTRTGEVQSRIANDIGGIETVVTSTATSVLSNVTTVLATIVAMVLLDWRLAAFALALLPLFVWLTKRVGAQRKKVTAERQVSLADVSSIVQESLSVSGILLGKTMGRTDDLAERFEGESRRLADLEVRSRMTGRWMMASIQMTFAIMPALVYWFAGFSIANGSQAITIGTLVAFTTLQTRLFFPIGGLLNVQVEVQSSLALFDRIFEYLDHEVDIVEGDRELRGPSGEVGLDSVWFRYDDAAWTLEDVSFTVLPGTKTALVGETGSGKTTCAYLVARLYDATRGTVSIDGVDVRDLTFDSLTSTVGVVSQETYLFHATVRENLRFAKPDASDEEIEEAAQGGADPRAHRDAARGLRHDGRRARLPLLRRREAADGDRANNSPESAGPRSRRGRRRRSTRRPSVSSRRRSSGSPRAGRRSRSPIVSRPCATRIRSWCSTEAGSSRVGTLRRAPRPRRPLRGSSSRETQPLRGRAPNFHQALEVAIALGERSGRSRRSPRRREVARSRSGD